MAKSSAMLGRSERDPREKDNNRIRVGIRSVTALGVLNVYFALVRPDLGVAPREHLAVEDCVGVGRLDLVSHSAPDLRTQVGWWRTSEQGRRRRRGRAGQWTRNSAIDDDHDDDTRAKVS